MTLAQRDFDVKLSYKEDAGSSEIARNFRLLTNEDGNKSWRVSDNNPPTPFNFSQDTWVWGGGLKHRSSREVSANEHARYFDGYGIDTTEPGVVKHGPASTTIGTISGTLRKMVLFDDRVWIVTSTHVYHWNGGTLTTVFTPSATDSINPVGAEVWGNYIIIYAGNDGYYSILGNGGPYVADKTHTSVGSGAIKMDHALTLNNVLWRAYDSNQVASTADPTASSPVWLTLAGASGALGVGPGETINNLFSLSGILGVATTASLYVVAADDEVVELDSRLRHRAGSNAFSIKTNDGNDVWFSDGTPDVLRINTVSFEIFSIQESGPFSNLTELPVSQDIAGNITSLTEDMTHIYAVADRSGDLYVYKGVQLSDGVFSWSPFARIESGSNDYAVVAKMSGDSDPILYLNDGSSIVSYPVRNWTSYTNKWFCRMPFVVGNSGNINKAITALNLLFDQSNDDASGTYRIRDTDGGVALTAGNIPAPISNSEVFLFNFTSAKQLSLEIEIDGNGNDDRVDLVSVLLEGIHRPAYERLFDFTVVVEDKGQADFIENARNIGGGVLFFIDDRFGTRRTTYMSAGYPIEQELFDATLNRPVRAYQIRAIEVVAS